MYIVVVGGGEVGFYLAKALLGEGHEALVIEKDDKVCEEINEDLGSISLHGDGCEAATLAEAGTERADMVIAVTGQDEDNLVACQVSKHKFKVRRTIARIKNPQNEALFKMLGIDVTISSTNLILEHIEEEVPTHALTHLLVLEGQEIVEIKIPPTAPTIGKAIRDFSLPADSKLLLIAREQGKNIVPLPNTTLLAGDRIIALTTHTSEEQLCSILAGRKGEQAPCARHKWGAKTYGGRRVCEICGQLEPL